MALNYHSMLGMKFVSGTMTDVRSAIFDLVDKKNCKVVVTPNVDHLIRVHENAGSPIWTAYQGADLRVCDSRVLALLGRLLFREDIIACPGADLVHSLLSDPGDNIKSILVFGPSARDFAVLARKFPETTLRFVEAPEALEIGAPAWQASIEEIEKLEWDVGLICISFPKQELFASSLRQRGIATGVMLCAGASIDFLTDKQSRAPLWIQQLSLEWCYRLFSSPRRLGRRYLYGIPKLIQLVYHHARLRNA